MGEIMWIVLSVWAVVIVYFFVLWRISIKQTNAGWVDVGWSSSLAFLVAWAGHWLDGLWERRMILTLVVVLWGLRLAWHILKRLLHEKKEDGRYQFLRTHWGLQANSKFFWFFQGQGFLNIILLIPIVLLMKNPSEVLLIWDYLAILIALISIGGESLADKQLNDWKAYSSNKGKTCRKGLWAYSRHPNYFFEWCFWLSFPVAGIGLWGTSLGIYWWLTLIGPVGMYFFLNRVTGIPYTEKQAIRSRGDDYKKYQNEVSAFFPWFNKS